MIFVIAILCFSFFVIGNYSLKFSKDGTFKILQVADLHFEGTNEKCRDIDPKQYPNCSEIDSLVFIARVIQAEKPDLVVYTGDNIDWATKNASLGMLQVFSVPESSETLWAAVLGNHDGQSTLSRKEVVEFMSSSKNFKFSLTELGPDDIHGYSNYVLGIYGNSDKEELNEDPLFQLFMLDSGDDSAIPEIKGYDWIFTSQLNWYLKKAISGVPSFSFFHIPLLEYKYLIDEGFPYTGSNLDVFHVPELNAGVYSSFVENGNMKAVFVGHDHLNDYCGKYFSGSLTLCYGGVVGLDAYSLADWKRRLRIIEITENGQSATTWKRLDDEVLSTEDIETLY